MPNPLSGRTVLRGERPGLSESMLVARSKVLPKDGTIFQVCEYEHKDPVLIIPQTWAWTPCHGGSTNARVANGQCSAPRIACDPADAAGDMAQLQQWQAFLTLVGNGVAWLSDEPTMLYRSTGKADDL